MSTATITKKGQITLPAAVREELKIGPGDRVEFVRVAKDHFELVAANQEISRLKGIVKTQRPVSIDQINAVIRMWAGRS